MLFNRVICTSFLQVANRAQRYGLHPKVHEALRRDQEVVFVTLCLPGMYPKQTGLLTT